MFYLYFLNKWCSSLSHEKCLVKCFMIVRSLITDKKNVDLNQKSMIDDLCHFFVISLDHVERSNSENLHALVRAVNVIETRELLFAHDLTYQQTVKEVKFRIDAYNRRIYATWGCEAYDVLLVHLYNFARLLFRHFMKHLCKLAETSERFIDTQIILRAIETSVNDFVYVSTAHVKTALQLFASKRDYARDRRSNRTVLPSRISPVRRTLSKFCEITTRSEVTNWNIYKIKSTTLSLSKIIHFSKIFSQPLSRFSTLIQKSILNTLYIRRVFRESILLFLISPHRDS